MKVSPKKFLEILRSTSLDKEEQDAIIQILPNLSVEQIDELVDVLQKDKVDLEKIFVEANTRMDEEIKKMEVNISQVMPFE